MRLAARRANSDSPDREAAAQTGYESLESESDDSIEFVRTFMVQRPRSCSCTVKRARMDVAADE